MSWTERVDFFTVRPRNLAAESAGGGSWTFARNAKVNSTSPFIFGAVILAAGSSQRMGRPKLLLPWAGTTVLGHLLQRWRELGAAQIAAVCAADAPGMQDEMNRLEFPEENRISNPAPARGMFSSIQCAAAWPGWKPELTHWVITLGDQPHIRQETLRRLLDLGRANPGAICQPLRGGHRKHPLCFPGREFAALKSSTASDLKQFLADYPASLAGFASDDPGLDFDMDRPEDYERARRISFP